MAKTKCLAMLLAGGQGSRLKELTKAIAKPAVSFGGKYRIIDFALSNCANSQITTVGVLTQYRPYLLHNYIGSGAAWNLDEAAGSGVSILPPYATQEGGAWYEGTADAIYRNLDYIEANNPDYVLILSGDHLYSMDYREMLKVHTKNKAALTISVMPVGWDEASRFGIITKNKNGSVARFTEKPKKPDSNLASMGIYIFTTKDLVRALKKDAKDAKSHHDFGKDIIPNMLAAKRRIFCYEFHGFWKDVGTVESYYDTAMMLLDEHPEFNLYDGAFPMLSNAPMCPPHVIGAKADVKESIVVNGCRIEGKVKHSIISINGYVAPGAVVEDSIMLPGSWVEAGAHVKHAIVGEGVGVGQGARVGTKGSITVVGDDIPAAKTSAVKGAVVKAAQRVASGAKSKA